MFYYRLEYKVQKSWVSAVASSRYKNWVQPRQKHFTEHQERWQSAHSLHTG